MLVQKKNDIMLIVCYLNNYFITKIFNDQDIRHSVDVGKELKQVKNYLKKPK